MNWLNIKPAGWHFVTSKMNNIIQSYDYHPSTFSLSFLQRIESLKFALLKAKQNIMGAATKKKFHKVHKMAQFMTNSVGEKMNISMDSAAKKKKRERERMKPKRRNLVY